MTEQVQTAPERHRFGYKLAVISDVGKRRSENQDAYAYAISQKVALYMVADGMGGARGGATASALAVKHITENAFDAGQSIDLERLRTAIAGSNSRIYARSQEDPNLFGMGTTIASLLVTGERAIIAHVGDSRVYRLRQGEFAQLTRDHTLVQELVDTGTIQEKEAAQHPIAHMLTRSLGPAEIIGVEARMVDEPLVGGERFLLCSDGLYNHVGFEQLKAILSEGSTDQAVKELIAKALEGGGSDNVTALVVEIAKEAYSAANPDTGLLPAPEGEVVTRVISREVPEAVEDEEALGDLPWENGKQSHENGHDRHDTTGYMKADEVSAYAAEQRQRADKPSLHATTQTLPIVTPRSNKSFAMGVLALGVIAGLVVVSRRPERMPDAASKPPITMASNTPDPDRDPLPLETQELPPPREIETEPETDDERIAWSPGASPAPTEAVELLPIEPAPTSAPLELPVAAESPLTLVGPNTVPATPELLPTAQPSGQSVVGPPMERPTMVASAAPSLIPTPPSIEAATQVVQQTLENIAPSDLRIGEIPLTVVTDAFAMNIPAPPRLDGAELEKIPELSANSPIVWEHESHKAAKIQAEDLARRVNGAENVRLSKTKIFSEDEKTTAARDKDLTRRRIADLDGKIALLFVPTKDEARKRGLEVEKEIASLRKDIQAKQKDLAKWEKVLGSWRLIKEQSLTMDSVQLADSAQNFSPEIRKSRDAFQKASDDYIASLSRWQNQSLDTQGTAQLAQLGREAKARRLELENKVRAEVSKGWLEADRQVARIRIELFGLERKKDLHVKFGGYVKGYIPTSGSPRVELYRKYLGDRAKLLKELKRLQNVMDDDAEVAYRLQEFSATPKKI